MKIAIVCMVCLICIVNIIMDIYVYKTVMADEKAKKEGKLK